MWIAEIWRYPVKSMAGERVASAEIRADGIAGDRLVHVRDHRGHVLTSRSKPALLAFRATLDAAGEPLVDALPWSDPTIAERVRTAAGATAKLARSDGVVRFDILPLLVATDGAIEAFGHDKRRLRPNLIIGGVEGMAERDWEDGTLTIGDVVIQLEKLRQRCVMTTWDPDTLAQDKDVLRFINERFAGKLALNASVVTPGTIREGDDVELTRA